MPNQPGTGANLLGSSSQIFDQDQVLTRVDQNVGDTARLSFRYNPNQMNTFTFLADNPPLNPRFTFFSEPTNPTLSLDNPFGEAAPNPPPSVTSPNRDLPDARKTQWSVDIQRELAPNTVLDLQYVGSRTRNLDRNFFANTPQPGPGPVDERRPNPNFGSIRIIENDLILNYDAFSVILRRRISQGLQVHANYTWSRTRDIATNSNAGGSVMDDFDPRKDFGPADWDVPHRFVASYIYELPFFQEAEQAFLRHVLAGWQISGITTIQSGTPINVTIGQDVANTGRGFLQRPDIIGTPSADCGKDNLANCIDASAFAVPAPFTFGNAPRNVIRGPNRIVTDLTLAKNVRIGQARVQLRADAFNVFNRANFNNPGTSFGTATVAQFGTSTFGTITSAQPMRRIQLGMRLTF